MAAWLPVIKVVLPYVAPIVSAALPAFSKKKSDKADPVVTEQIAELQEAVKTNTESVKALAKAVEELAMVNDLAIRRARLFAGVATAVAAVSLAVALAAWLA